MKSPVNRRFLESLTNQDAAKIIAGDETLVWLGKALESCTQGQRLPHSGSVGSDIQTAIYRQVWNTLYPYNCQHEAENLWH